jgi:hypothetical protein
MEVTMASKSNGKASTDDAKFLFKGTIQKLNASASAHVPRSEQVAIVRVDEIMHAPPALAKTLGKQITVKLVKGAKPKAGEQVLFHANGWLFGETVAVEAVKQEKPAEARTMLTERTADPTRNFKNRELEQRIADAEMVVEGEVSSIHLPPSESFVAARSPGRPVSEHDPKWREAIVTVATVHKGEPSTKQVVVRFPSSMDVQWHRAPKFRTGDRGVWLLQSLKRPAAAAAGKGARRALPSQEVMMASAVPGAAAYTALHPMDFYPANKLDTVASVIRAAVAAKKP